MDNLLHVDAVELNAEGGAVPDWVELIPAGRIVRGRDGRSFLNSEPERIVRNFADSGKATVIDWEHGSEAGAKENRRAAAAGWIEDMQLRDGALYGRVKWTPQGRDDVATRSYRYLSPTFVIKRNTGEIASLASVGLVHNPNLYLKALNMEDDAAGSLAKIKRALSLETDADDKAILGAIEKLRNAVLEENSAHGDVVPRTDYDFAIARLRQFETEEAERHENAILTAVDEIIAVGDPNFPPARRASYIEMCRQEGGLERFREIARPDPARSLCREETIGRKTPNRGMALAGEQAKIIQTLGLDPKALDG